MRIWSAVAVFMLIVINLMTTFAVPVPPHTVSLNQIEDYSIQLNINNNSSGKLKINFSFGIGRKIDDGNTTMALFALLQT